MITRDDIVGLELTNISTPRVLPLYAQYRSGESTKRFVAIGDAVARALTGINPEDFDAQLDEARAENANLVGWGEGRACVHVIGSVIAPANGVLARNLFIPHYYLNDVSRIQRVFIAYFLRQDPKDDSLRVEVGGWTDAATVAEDLLADNSPASFTSSLKVHAVPVSTLFPISTLPKLDYNFVF